MPCGVWGVGSGVESVGCRAYQPGVGVITQLRVQGSVLKEKWLLETYDLK